MWGRDYFQQARLYLILDTGVLDEPALLERLKEAVRGGVDVVQLRNKNMPSVRQSLVFARRVRRILRGRIPFIVNDRIDLALAAGADGVHLGQEDLPLEWARRIMGPRAVVGISCQTLAHARRAGDAGADYIGLGSVFPTLTKPERQAMDRALLSRVLRQAAPPVFAIGGIDSTNIASLAAAGVARVAVTRAILLSGDVRGTIRALRQALADVS